MNGGAFFGPFFLNDMRREKEGKMSMNILITGASGFIGTALVKYLADKHTVICLSRQAPEGAFKYVQGSFDSVKDLSGLDYPR